MEKKLSRSASNSIISGVCGGLAQYFGMDATLVRILFVVLLFGGSLGFWAYLLLWAFLPKTN